jgi:predicted permease
LVIAMFKFGRFFPGLRARFVRNRFEGEMDDELRFHLDRQIEDNIAGGMTREEARSAALRNFGGVEQIKEECRDARGTRFLREVWQDLRYGLRMLRRSPAFAAAAVLSLALGIGVNTAIFTLIDALMLRMLPVERPQELVVLKKVHPLNPDDQFSYAAYIRFRDGAADFAGILAATVTDTVNIFLKGEPELVSRQSVSGNYFAVLGVRPVLGRALEPGDDRLPAGDPVAVISYGFWQRRFGRDPSVLGQGFTLKGTSFSIIGVAPAEFFGETVGKAPDIWTPVTVQPGAPSWLWSGHSVTWLRIAGRLGPGITREQARSRLDPIFERMQNEIASGMKETRFRNQVLETRFRVEDGSLGLSELRERFSLPLRILMAVVGLVLMIACANIANLLLARAAARQREFAVRLAIGAGRARLIRQLLTESLLLSVLGGTFGLALSRWASKVLLLLVSRASAPIPLDLRPDARILAFTAGLSLLTGILFGFAPALRATRFDLAPSLKQSTERGRGRFSLAKTLVAAQVAVSLLLLVGAGLFVRSLQKLESIDAGFDPEQVLLFRIDPRATGYKRTDLASLYRRLLERAESVPGVRAASGSFFGLFTGATWGNTLTVEGYTPRAGETVHSLANAVMARYFEVMGIPILHGRSISWADHENAPRVAVVNQTFARLYFGKADPIGKRFGLGSPPKEMIEIVGVAKDAKYVHLREAARPMLYVPFLQYPSGLTELEIRAAGDPSALAATLRRELAAVDRNLPVLGVTSLGEQVAASIAAERLIAKLSSAFGLLALLLACIGLYGVLAYSVSRRTSEIGIRIALGARPGDVRWLVLRESLLLILLGSAAGLAAALAAGRWISSQLFGVAPDDPLIFSLATISMLAVGTLAGYLPARRASRVDPMAALRYE